MKTTPYHPQTNGQTKRVNGMLVSILRKTVMDSKRLGYEVDGGIVGLSDNLQNNYPSHLFLLGV